MFTGLPSGFPQLEEALRKLGPAVNLGSIPDLRSMAQRLRDSYAQKSDRNYSGLRGSEVRRVPYAYWFDGSPSLPNLHPALTSNYWLQATEGASSRPLTAKRWLVPLFFTYVTRFQASDAEFQDFAERLRALLPTAVGPLGVLFRDLQQHYEFFTPGRVARKIAEALIESLDSPEQWLQRHVLPAELGKTALGGAIFAELLKRPVKERRNVESIRKILQWSAGQPTHPHDGPLRVEFADALLGPWLPPTPSDALKRLYVKTFTSANSYGHPGQIRRANYRWHGVSPEAITTIHHCLAGESLRVFLDILQRTADRTWEYRQRFWMAYYEGGYISEAWLALGKNAMSMYRERHRSSGLACSSLEGAEAKQSVLLLKLANLTFVEWSHNGSLRAFREDGVDTPSLYDNYYESSKLRDARSIDFHGPDSGNTHPYLYHHRSEEGTWQRKARDLIRRETNIYIRDAEILL